MLPPPLVHELRLRSFTRLFRMAGNPGNRGFGRVLRKRIRDIVARERTLVEKAVTVAYMGSYLVDHIIFAVRAANRILALPDLSEDGERRLWEQNYADVVQQLADELPEGDRLLDEIGRLERYTRLSPRLHAFRTRHWPLVRRLLDHPAPPGALHPLGDTAVVTRIEEVLRGTAEPRRQARLIALLASFMADSLCWNQHMDWAEAYREVMVDLYPLLAQRGAVLEQLVRLE